MGRPPSGWEKVPAALREHIRETQGKSPWRAPEAGVAWTRGPCSGFRDACMSPGVSKGIASCRRGRRVSGVLAAGLMGLVRSRPWEHLGFSLESWEPVREDETRGMGRRWGSVGSPGGGSPLAGGLGFCGSIQDPGAVARLGGPQATALLRLLSCPGG